ncbi:lysozyme [Fusarium odoratissimum NRRL 54006]|uniref:Lysozyme n=1 Tax=Fusarium odoratissimum (strain NRRL 54006) TaxID=1089451 RepID=X0IVL1_FUSO5|nr:lysozyme [Fusarium odoratissimum NRRL 54006]EXL92978.1 lysozyme [Fusarium odoratissimum NRRL 54006]
MKIHIFAAHFLAVASSAAFLITDEGRQFAKGTDVAITCQTEGTHIKGNVPWDKMTFGCYVSDYYVATGSSRYVTSKCQNDPTGNPTVGYGHLCDAAQCSEVKYPIPLSIVNGKKLLADGMKEFEICNPAMLNSKANLNRNQYGALISWAFNMGRGNADSSTLVGRLNNGEDPNTVISQELPQWVMPVARDFRV